MKRETALAVAVLLFIAVAWVWFATDRPGNLLPHGSVKLASVANWKEPTGQTMSPSAQKFYFWTTKGDLLHLLQNANGSISVVRDHLLAVNALQNDFTPPLLIPPDALFPRPTPDGSGVIYGQANAAHSRDLTIHLLSADGTGDRLLSGRWMPNPIWTPDGKYWLVNRTDGIYVNSLDGAPARKLNTAALSAWTPFVLGVNAQSRIVSTLGTDQFEPPTLFRRVVGLHTPTGVLTEFDMTAPTRNPKTWNVTMPAEAFRGRILLSPQADRILWIAEKQSSGLSLWVNRLRLGFYRAYEGDEAVYVSQLDGTGMKQLFSGPVERLRRGVNITTTRPLTDIQWLPDGKRISFVYKDDLYLTPVD